MGYCEKFGLPDSAAAFVAHLRERLADTARQLDERFPEKSDHVIINKAGELIVRRTAATVIPESAVALHRARLKRMPVRNLLDVLANIEHWTHFTRHFGPLSGHDPKIRNAAERYLLTSRRVLAYRVAITLESCHAVEAIEEAFAKYGNPEIVNTDQGSQFTATDFTDAVLNRGIQLSMDGKGSWRDNVFVERLWRSVKYEEVYLKAYDSVSHARRSIADYLRHAASDQIGSLTAPALPLKNFGSLSEQRSHLLMRCPKTRKNRRLPDCETYEWPILHVVSGTNLDGLSRCFRNARHRSFRNWTALYAKTGAIFTIRNARAK